MAAPSTTPRRPGDLVKTNRRDSRKLARLHRAGELTTIVVPNEHQEALRDLMRAREDVLEDATRRRHRLTKFLLRHGHKYRLGRAWTRGHWQWMAKISFEDPSLQTVFEQYRLSLDQALEQLKTFNQEVEALAQRPEFARPINCLMGFRGIKVITAMTIPTEAIDLRRYVSAPALMSAIGLVPSEHSTGTKERRGSITKTGNAHMRRVVVEASWHYRHSPIVSKALKQRRRELPPEVLRLVQRADQRLHKKFRKLVNKGKRSTVAAVAVARELAGFIWAVVGCGPSSVGQCHPAGEEYPSSWRGLPGCKLGAAATAPNQKRVWHCCCNGPIACIFTRRRKAPSTMVKTISIRERYRVQFRGEFFNALNRPNFNAPFATRSNRPLWPVGIGRRSAHHPIGSEGTVLIRLSLMSKPSPLERPCEADGGMIRQTSAEGHS